MTTAIEQTLETYGIENWGAGYFDVNRKGNLVVRPAEGDPRSADLKEIIDDLARRGIGAPVLLRFPQLVAAQVRKLQRAFSRSIREFEYQGAHMCVYPMKVNQQRAVVEEYLREGSRYDFGLEAGSKPELGSDTRRSRRPMFRMTNRRPSPAHPPPASPARPHHRV